MSDMKDTSGGKEKRMSKREALSILIQAGQRDITGSGMGYRSTTDEWRTKVAKAIEVIYPIAHPGVPFNAFNLGIQSALNS